ncbi:MAG TPA: DUF86 domain-containing protein [Bacteroidetes bacterium]|nr:DUF86 domain-containing protein [Bacteroidota bacterium]
MYNRKWKFRVDHILQSIQNIQDYTKSMTFNAFENDRKTVDAVVRNFLIIGEAVKFIPVNVQNRYKDIPWEVMRGMRNVLVHDYDRVKEEVLWETIQLEIQPLIPLLKKILDETDD